MILTGSEIAREWANGRLVITPFTPEHVNPNSFNFRLGPKLHVYRPGILDPRRQNEYDEIVIPDEGYVLEPSRLYLGHTIEVLGSDSYAPTFAARSSVARLGLFINLSASLGDIGFKGQWTLQLYSINRIRIYSGMVIGQMMWWKPQGEIQLYNGKYQGSAGPRVSDIHKDFEKQMTRTRFPSLGATVDPTQVGAKFCTLSTLADTFDVPPAFAIPADEFDRALTEQQRVALAAEFGEARATVGAFLAESATRLADLAAQIHVPPQMRCELDLRIAETFGAFPAVGLAVRSSGLDEDGAESSLAGIHRSVLRLRDLDSVVDAIERCWRAYYELPAVAARIRGGNHDWRPRLALFVQQMVDADLAGVAFSGLADADDIRVEYVSGLADRLVSGEQLASSFDARTGSADPEQMPTLSAVVGLIEQLRDRLGHDVDVEWAADGGGVKLLQCRPATARLSAVERSTTPTLEAYRMYHQDLPPSFVLADVAGVYGSYVAKRGPAHRLAHELGIATGVGWVLRYNRRGLREAETRGRLIGLLAQGTAIECVLDLGDTLRQVILPKADVPDWLSDASSSDPAGASLSTVIIREFVRGNAGVISRRTGQTLLVEMADEGLLALNRGTASARRLTVPEIDKPHVLVADAGTAVLVAHIPAIVQMTEAMAQRYGPVTLEWVLADDRLYFTDYSLLSGEEALCASSAGTILSPGAASGPIIRVEDEVLLERLSVGPAVSIDKSVDVSEHEGLAKLIERVRSQPERPIVVASRPYAVLSVLIGDVAGFVFDGGSVLCHLAILLREARVPAIVAPEPVGDYAVIGDGVLTASRLEAVR